MRLKELRKAKGLSQQEAAKELNIPRSTYTHYELNKRGPRMDVLIKLADYFDVTLDYLVGREK